MWDQWGVLHNYWLRLGVTLIVSDNGGAYILKCIWNSEFARLVRLPWFETPRFAKIIGFAPHVRRIIPDSNISWRLGDWSTIQDLPTIGYTHWGHVARGQPTSRLEHCLSKVEQSPFCKECYRPSRSSRFGFARKIPCLQPQRSHHC